MHMIGWNLYHKITCYAKWLIENTFHFVNFLLSTGWCIFTVKKSQSSDVWGNGTAAQKRELNATVNSHIKLWFITWATEMTHLCKGYDTIPLAGKVDTLHPLYQKCTNWRDSLGDLSRWRHNYQPHQRQKNPVKRSRRKRGHIEGKCEL